MSQEYCIEIATYGIEIGSFREIVLRRALEAGMGRDFVVVIRGANLTSLEVLENK